MQWGELEAINSWSTVEMKQDKRILQLKFPFFSSTFIHFITLFSIELHSFAENRWKSTETFEFGALQWRH